MTSGPEFSATAPPRDATFQIDVFTLFPSMFAGPFDSSILRRARDRLLISIDVHDIRQWAPDRHRTADDTPYGGGAGMVMSVAPIVTAVEETIAGDLPETAVLILSASGRRFNQSIAQTLAQRRRIALICGHYEGIDERVAEMLGADQLSVGDVVLTGGEIPAMVVVDAVSRLRPGVIEAASIEDETHSGAYVEYPHYTRPSEYRGSAVPAPLLRGNHAEIARWRASASRARTARWRPDLMPRLSTSRSHAAGADPA